MVKQSKAAKNYWSLLIEKYKAKLAPIITGNEHIARLTIDKSENGRSLFGEISFIENWSLSNILVWTILYSLKLKITLNTKNTLSVQKWFFSHLVNNGSAFKYLQ